VTDHHIGSGGQASTRHLPDRHIGSGDGPTITVVVVNWNGERLLPDCLDALAKQDLGPDGAEADGGVDARMAVWMVDNASTDGSVALVERDYPWVRVLRNPRNEGFAGGNNVALHELTTPFVALLNSDARPAPEWLRNLVAPMLVPGGERIGATTSKLLFQPRFLPLRLATAAFLPGGLDPRTLGVRVHAVRVDGADVTEEVLWERAAYGPEGTGPGRFRWTRPAGELLVPVAPAGEAAGTVRLGLRLAADAGKDVRLQWPGGSATLWTGPELDDREVDLQPAGGLVDVLNNTGSIVFGDGYGADRAYQEVDRGQFEQAEDVFALCGAACCLRTAALRESGPFDPDFFLYYEDTDLSWRLGALGWRILYEPSAVVRHIHAASSSEWSPLFTFHVDRNRLLMLTKNAHAALALREVARYPLTTASLALRQLAQARHSRRRPAVRPTLLRLRVIGSYLRLLPRMLARRRAIAATAVASRQALARWFVPR
jgi:GT2 family glycosyltransferase